MDLRFAKNIYGMNLIVRKFVDQEFNFVFGIIPRSKIFIAGILFFEKFFSSRFYFLRMGKPVKFEF